MCGSTFNLRQAGCGKTLNDGVHTGHRSCHVGSLVAGLPVGRGLASRCTAGLPGKELVVTDDVHKTDEFCNHVMTDSCAALELVTVDHSGLLPVVWIRVCSSERFCHQVLCSLALCLAYHPLCTQQPSGHLSSGSTHSLVGRTGFTGSLSKGTGSSWDWDRGKSTISSLSSSSDRETPVLAHHKFTHPPTQASSLTLC